METLVTLFLALYFTYKMILFGMSVMENSKIQSIKEEINIAILYELETITLQEYPEINFVKKEEKDKKIIFVSDTEITKSEKLDPKKNSIIAKLIKEKAFIRCEEDGKEDPKSGQYIGINIEKCSAGKSSLSKLSM